MAPLIRYLPQLLVRLRLWKAASEILGGGGHRDGRSMLEETMSRSRLPALCRDCLGLQDSIETRSACSITTSSDGSIPCRGDQGA